MAVDDVSYLLHIDKHAQTSHYFYWIPKETVCSNYVTCAIEKPDYAKAQPYGDPGPCILYPGSLQVAAHSSCEP